LPKPGVDAVGGLVAARELLDDVARGADALARGVGQSDALALVRDRNQIVQRHRGPVQFDHSMVRLRGRSKVTIRLTSET
jgi:hypothetical protein